MAGENITQIWPDWEVEKQLGRGSYGVVYQVVKRDYNVESRAAIKVISIPANASEVDSLRSDGLDDEGTKSFFEGVVGNFVDEIRIMETLKGVQNIISVEDFKVVERVGEFGWDIYIRMELLKPFNHYMMEKRMTQDEVIQLGVDICTALEICEKRGIIHRDIKPENIFVNDFGYFKLGDFGIARKMENASGGLSQKGTFNYIAPEVTRSTGYDARVDLYSLGIVLYRLMNQNRLPFIENELQLRNPNDRQRAVDRRLNGERLTPPCMASSEMAAVILKACAFMPDNRFANATEMKEALLQVRNGTYRVPAVEDDLDKTMRVRPASGQGPVSAPPKPQPVQGWSERNAQPVQNGWTAPQPQPVQNGWTAPKPQTVQNGWTAPQSQPAQNGWTAPQSQPAQNGWTAPKPQPVQNGWTAPQFQPAQNGWTAPQSQPAQNGWTAPQSQPAQNGWTAPQPQPVKNGWTAPQYPNHQGASQVQPVKQKKNGLCKFALISIILPLVLVGMISENDISELEPGVFIGIMAASLLPMVLALMGRSQTGRTNTKGNGLALAAYIVGACVFIVILSNFLVDLCADDGAAVPTVIIATVVAIIAYRLAVSADKKNR